MKKSIITLMALSSLVACSEDSYQESDKINQVENIDNSSDGNIKPMTSGLYYNSPFNPHGTGLNNGILTRFINNTPLEVELEAFAAEIDYTTVIPGGYTLYPSTFIIMKPFSSEFNQDFGAPMSIIVPPYSVPQGNTAMMYDFGSHTINYRFYHYGKVQYFRYIIKSEGGIIDEGYIKQRFFDDTNNSDEVNALDNNWVYLEDINSLPMYELAAMYHITSNEICLTNRINYTTNPFESSITVTDPITSTAYTMEFYTDSSGVYLTFN